MPILNWLVLFGALLALVLFFVGLMEVISRAFPTPENRPAPTGLIEANEEKRIAALKRVADRQRHAQRQRDASARLTRGF